MNRFVPAVNFQVSEHYSPDLILNEPGFELMVRDILNRLAKAIKTAEANMTPAHLLSDDEKMGMAIAAGVPVSFADGKFVTDQPVGISRIAGQYHVYTKLEDK